MTSPLSSRERSPEQCHATAKGAGREQSRVVIWKSASQSAGGGGRSKNRGVGRRGEVDMLPTATEMGSTQGRSAVDGLGEAACRRAAIRAASSWRVPVVARPASAHC
eukprot:2694074-Rhodomonas_salina.1